MKLTGLVLVFLFSHASPAHHLMLPIRRCSPAGTHQNGRRRLRRRGRLLNSHHIRLASSPPIQGILPPGTPFRLSQPHPPVALSRPPAWGWRCRRPTRSTTTRRPAPGREGREQGGVLRRFPRGRGRAPRRRLAVRRRGHEDVSGDVVSTCAVICVHHFGCYKIKSC